MHVVIIVHNSTRQHQNKVRNIQPRDHGNLTIFDIVCVCNASYVNVNANNYFKCIWNDLC